MKWEESRDPVKRWIARHKVVTGIVAVVVALIGIGALSNQPEPRRSTGNTSTPVTSLTDTGSPSAEAAELIEEDSSSSSYESSGETNAREKAASYLSHSSFSRKGLIEQLEYEGFTNAESVYGVDANNVDWNEQAALKAASYLSHSSFSRTSLQEQLEYEGFTPSQASYGVSQSY